MEVCAVMPKHLPLIVLPLWFLLTGQGNARQDELVCGTTREKWKEELHLHRQASRIRRGPAMRRQSEGVAPGRAGIAPAPAVTKDAGDIVLLEDADGVIARRNEFNLDRTTLTFWAMTPGAERYRFGVGENSYDFAAAAAGTRIEGLTDDDTRMFTLPFRFPFFGAMYESVYVNSDGNLTFGAGDTSSSARSLGRMTAGSPRISGLFRDLDPSMSKDGVRVLSTADRFVVSWAAVPEYREQGIGPLQTFQIRLFPNGRIEFAYAGIDTTGAVVGIAPGNLKGASTVLSFLEGGAASRDEYSGAIAERFGGQSELDVVVAAQKFYETHEDAYDYLVIFNNLDVSAGDNALAYEMTLRNHVTGTGDEPRDIGREFGSPYRLKAVINMGPLRQYPPDPNGLVPGRILSRETTLGILGHETGHLFLAYASIRDPRDPRARPLLGRQLAHWSFVFNSEASLVEGNRIRDNGAGTSPRFVTIGNTEAYSPLDQYLMGFLPPEEVPPVFVVRNATVAANRAPERGVAFDGERLEVRVEDIIAAEGRRTPDHTVAQRRFRLAFLLVVPKGADPSSEETRQALDKVDAIRRAFEEYFRTASGGRGLAETSLRRSVRLSLFPAAGVIQGGSLEAAVSLQKPAEAPLRISLRAQNGAADVPESMVIPAGGTKAVFRLTGVRAGVEELTAEPDDTRYETAAARVQVAPSPASIRLVVVSGDKQTATAGRELGEPVVLRAMDANNLPYPGLRVNAAVSAGGTVAPAAAITDENGTVSFRWTPGAAGPHRLVAALEGGGPEGAVTVTAAGRPAIGAGGVVNAASFDPVLSPGAFGTVFGTELSLETRAAPGFPLPATLGGARVLLNGAPAPLAFVTDRQINFFVPLDTPQGNAEVVVLTSAGASAPATIPIEAVSPGLFFDTATGFGAVVVAGTRQTTAQRPAASGEYIEIYATGLGPVRNLAGTLRETELPPRVVLGSQPLTEINYSGLAPGFLGLYQINARIPEGYAAGVHPLYVEIGGRRSNVVKIQVR